MLTAERSKLSQSGFVLFVHSWDSCSRPYLSDLSQVERRVRMRALKVCLLILSLLLVVVKVCYGGDLNLELIATMTGENEGDRFGRRVAGLGDINNDGYDDVAVNGAGKVYIFFGSSGFDSIADMILDDGIAHS